MAKTKTVASDYEDQDAVELFNDAVRKEMKRPGVDRQKAIARVAQRDPGLHQAFLLQTNPSARARRLVNEKYNREE